MIFGIPAHVAAPPPPPLLASLDERTQARTQPTYPSARLIELDVIFRMTDHAARRFYKWGRYRGRVL